VGRPKLPDTKVVWFRGREYTKSRTCDYFRRYCKRTGKLVYLHRDVWEHHRGGIPAGYHVHHKNRDKCDNRIENLECLSPAEHHGRHDDLHKSEETLRLLDRIRPPESVLAPARQRYWREVQPKDYVCVVCGTGFKSKHNGIPKYCSARCKEKKRVRPLLGKVCAWCKGTFTTRKPATACCSNKCSQQRRRASL
jgi:hypothetical protein